MNDFERESSTMDMKEEMMSDAVDDEDEGEGEEAEGDKILKEVLDEIGMGMNDAVSSRGQRPTRAFLEERRLDEQRTELTTAYIRTYIEPHWTRSCPCFPGGCCGRTTLDA
jgi:hypothetical protein